jgi:hypothetical protein
MKISHTLSVGVLLAALSAPAWAVPIVGSEDAVNNTAQLSYSVASSWDLRISLTNTSSYDARITGFGFDVDGGSALGLWSVSGTLDNDEWSFSYDAIPGSEDRDAFAVTGANLWGGNTNDGIKVGKTGIFDFWGTFQNGLSLSNIVVRFQNTGRNGGGSDKAYACSPSCSTPVTSVPEPSSLALFGAGMSLFGFVARRRRAKR